MAFRRVSEIKPWLVDFLLSENPRTSGESLHILKYVSGPHEDGSIVKAATDRDVIINVRFTAHALAVFTNTVDSESPDTHEEFNRALIILKKYWSAHCPQSDKASSHFEVVIDDFSLWMNETGLRLKVEPLPCMQVQELRSKSNRLWTEWKLQEDCLRASATNEEESETEASQNGGEPSMSSIPLSQLLDQMGVSSSSVVEQEKGTVRGGVFTGQRRLSLLRPSDLPVQLPEDVDPSKIHISQDQQIKLNNIPEWKTGYRPPAVSYVSSCPSTESSAAKTSPARPSSQADSSLSRKPLPDRPWRRANTDNSLRLLGTMVTVQPSDDQVTTSDMGTGTYGIDVAIQVGESMLRKPATGVTHHTEIAAQVGDSLLNPHVFDSQSQYVSESQCDFQSQCAFDDVTKVLKKSDHRNSLSKSSLDSVDEVDDPCTVIQSQSTVIDLLEELGSNDQITDTQGQRLTSSREESSDASTNNRSKSTNSASNTKDNSRDTNIDDQSFVTEDSFDKDGLADDVGDYNSRVRLSCSESPEGSQTFRKSLRSASATSIEKVKSRKERRSIDDCADISVKLDQVQRIKSTEASSDGPHRRSPRARLQKEAAPGGKSKHTDDNTATLVKSQVERLKSVDSSDDDYRRSPRLQQGTTPEHSQVQRMKSVDASDGDHRRSPRLQPEVSKGSDDNLEISVKLGQAQLLQSLGSTDGDHRRSPRLQPEAAPGKELPLGRKVAVLKDVAMQRSSPQNRQDNEENFGESEDIIMPTPPKVSRKGFSPLRPVSRLSSQKNASPLVVDPKGTQSMQKAPVTFEVEAVVHYSQDDTPRNLEKQLLAVDTSASAKAASSPGRVGRSGTEASVSKHQEIVAEAPATGEEISPARPDQICPRIPEEDVIITLEETEIEETEVEETPVIRAEKTPVAPRSAGRGVTQGPFHSTQISPETTKELPPLKLTLSPIKTKDRFRIDIRRKRGSQGRRDITGRPSYAGDSKSSEESGADEKAAIISPLPKTTDPARSINRSAEEKASPPEIQKAPTDTAKLLPFVSLERLELSKYKSTSSGSVIIDDIESVHQEEALQKDPQTPAIIVISGSKTTSQKQTNDISEDKSTKKPVLTDKVEEEVNIQETTKSPHLSVTPRRVQQTLSDKDGSKKSNESPRLSVTHGRKVGRPRKSTSQEDSPIYANRKERLKVTRQNVRPTKGFKFSSSSPSGRSSPSSEDEATTPARKRSKTSLGTPQTPQAAEQGGHSRGRHESSNSSVSVGQFYSGSESSPSWRSPRVPLSVQTKDTNRKGRPPKLNSPTGKSPFSKSPRSSKFKAQAERRVSHTKQGKFNVTRKSPLRIRVTERTSGEDDAVTSPTFSKVGSRHITKVPHSQSDEDSSIVEIDDSTNTPIRKRGRPWKSETPINTPDHVSKMDSRLKKATPRNTPKGVQDGDTFSTSSESASAQVQRKVKQRHTRKYVIPKSAKVRAAPLVDEVFAEEIDNFLAEEVDDGAKTQSDDEDFKVHSPSVRKKLQEITYQRPSSGRRGKLLQRGTQADTPSHPSGKKTPRKTPRTDKIPQKEAQSEEDRPIMRVRASVNKKQGPRHRMWINDSEETSVEEIDDAARSQSDDEDYNPDYSSSGTKSELENKTPVSKRGKVRKSKPEVEPVSKKNSRKVTKRGNKALRKELPSEDSSQPLTSSPHQKVRPSRKTKSAALQASRAALQISTDDSSIEEVDNEDEESDDEVILNLKLNVEDVDDEQEASGDEDNVSELNLTLEVDDEEESGEENVPELKLEVDDEENAQSEGEDSVSEVKLKVNKKKADSHKPASRKKKGQRDAPSEKKRMGKSKRKAETDENSEDERVSDDEDFKPSPRKKIKGPTCQQPTAGQKGRKAKKESSDEPSEDEEDEDYSPSDREDDEDYNPSPGTKLQLPLVGKSTRRHEDRTKLSLAIPKKKPVQQKKKFKAKSRMNVQLAETGRIEIIQEKSVPHNLSALFSASKKPASAKLKPSHTRKRKLFSEQTLLGELLPEVPEVSEKPAKGCNLRLKMASPLKPLLPKLSGKRQVYDISDDSDLVTLASDKSSSSIGNSESTPLKTSGQDELTTPLKKTSENQETGTTENINSPPLANVAEEEEGDEFSMTTPVSSLPSHQPLTKDSSPEESSDGSVLPQKDDKVTEPGPGATVPAKELDNLDNSQPDQVAALKAPSTPGKAPSTPGKAPSTPGKAPSTPGKAPSTPGKAFSTPGRAPGSPRRAPSSPGRAPGSPGRAPGSPGRAPGSPRRAPSSPGRAPGSPGRAPGSPGRAFSSPMKRGITVSTPTSSLPSHQPEQGEEAAELKNTPIREEIQLILSALPKDQPACVSSPLTDMDMPRDLITKLSTYFVDDEFA